VDEDRLAGADGAHEPVDGAVQIEKLLGWEELLETRPEIALGLLGGGVAAGDEQPTDRLRQQELVAECSDDVRIRSVREDPAGARTRW